MAALDSATAAGEVAGRKTAPPGLRSSLVRLRSTAFQGMRLSLLGGYSRRGPERLHPKGKNGKGLPYLRGSSSLNSFTQGAMNENATSLHMSALAGSQGRPAFIRPYETVPYTAPRRRACRLSEGSRSP